MERRTASARRAALIDAWEHARTVYNQVLHNYLDQGKYAPSWKQVLEKREDLRLAAIKWGMCWKRENNG